MATLFASFCVALAVTVRRRFSRFEVSGASMSPTYNPGDWLIVDLRAFRGRLPRPGEVVILRDPRAPKRQIMKRVSAVTLHGELDVRGDNRAESTDTRTFGPVERSLLVGKVLWRFHKANQPPLRPSGEGEGVGG
ncbi:MAG: nickel-type superoxide dismutase maturation protease [Anaerolinea sp.]|nr:nickel-type superoxide dismutase maturation protease [Anaerolinea sp.]